MPGTWGLLFQDPLLEKGDPRPLTDPRTVTWSLLALGTNSF